MITNSDLRLTIFGCFRYSLGRKTYMPSTICKIIKDNPELFNSTDWERFIEEINECEDLGMNCDKKTWNDLNEFCKERVGK
jgi:hypothetical protein